MEKALPLTGASISVRIRNALTSTSIPVLIQCKLVLLVAAPSSNHRVAWWL